MKYRPIEPSTELLYKLCSNINEDCKHILSEICFHNQIYPVNKIVISYINGNNFAEISDERKNEVTFVHTICQNSDYKYILGLIIGYGKGLEAAGIKRQTPKEL